MQLHFYQSKQGKYKLYRYDTILYSTKVLQASIVLHHQKNGSTSTCLNQIDDFNIKCVLFYWCCWCTKMRPENTVKCKALNFSANFDKPVFVFIYMTDHGNVMMSSGSPILDFVLRYINADASTNEYSKRHTQARDAFQHSHKASKRSTVPPSELNKQLQSANVTAKRCTSNQLSNMSKKAGFTYVNSIKTNKKNYIECLVLFYVINTEPSLCPSFSSI